MRVLMLGWELPPTISGGMGVACDGMLRGLGEQGGTSVQFLIPLASPAPETYPPRIRIVELDDCTESLLASLRSHTATAGYIEKARRYTGAVLRALRRLDGFDLVHAHDWLTFEAAIQIKRFTGKPLVVHIHSTEDDRSTLGGANPVIAALERQGMDEADRVVTVSEYSKERLIQRYGQAARKVEVIYNAATHRLAARPHVSPNAEKYVTFIGRITRQKGPEVFVRAALEIRRAVPSARFVMAGDGDLLPSIRSLVEKLGMQEAFSFPGFIRREQVDQLLARSEVMILPSLSEPFGLAALEAIQAGVPVVLSRNCGLIEQIPSVACVNPEDPTAIAAAAIQILENRERASARAEVVKREAAHLGWTASAGQLLDVYRAVTSQTQ